MSEFKIEDPDITKMLKELTEDQKQNVADRLQDSLNNARRLIELYDNGNYNEFLEGVKELSSGELPLVADLVEKAKQKVE